jgi:putative ATP-dependent endonuclease of the OLD family
MRVSRLKINGFRGAKNAEISFGEHSVLVGPNNCGKTTIVEALALLFGRDKMVRRLTEHDFFGSEPDEKSRILIIATITDFATNDPTHYPTWLGQARGGTEKWLDPATGQLHAAPASDPALRLAVQVGFAARFDLEELEAETIRFFVDDEETVGDPFGEEAHVVPIPGTTLKELGFFFVPASRTWDRWISFSSELFRRVVSTLGEIPAQAIRKERARLWNPAEADRLENETGLQSIVSLTNRELSHLMSWVPALELRVTGTDSASVLDAVVPHYKQGAGPSLPTSRHGSGLVSLQSLLLLMQFGRARAEQGKSFILAVEEPELHIQPSQQKRLVNRLNALCDQTIVTTHSPLVASMFAPPDIHFAESKDGTLTTRLLATTDPAEPSNHVQHLLFGWRQRLIAALMHECVLIPEGASDVSWLEVLQRGLELHQEWDEGDKDGTRFGTFVGVVPTNDCKILETLGVVKRVHANAAVLVDGDSAGKGYLGEVCASDTPPKTAIIWPDDWKMETVIGWLVEADHPTLLPALGTALEATLASKEDLVAPLLTRKTYVPTHEIASAVMIANEACRKRTAALLGAMTNALTGAEPGSLFEHDTDQSTAATRVFRLTP